MNYAPIQLVGTRQLCRACCEARRTVAVKTVALLGRRVCDGCGEVVNVPAPDLVAAARAGRLRERVAFGTHPDVLNLEITQ